MAKRMIEVLVLEASDAKQQWRIETIDGDDYRELRRLVKGNLGTCSLPPSMRQMGFFAYCDDDSMIRPDLPALNSWAIYLGQAHLRGPVVILRADEEGTEEGLTDDDVLGWTDYLQGPPSAEAREMANQSAAWWASHPSGSFIESFDNIEDFLKQMGHRPPGR